MGLGLVIGHVLPVVPHGESCVEIDAIVLVSANTQKWSGEVGTPHSFLRGVHHLPQCYILPLPVLSTSVCIKIHEAGQQLAH